MLYLVLLGMLALWLTPAVVAQAEEPPSAASTPSLRETTPPQPLAPPAGYAEDFSRPDEMVAAHVKRYEAFGEDDAAEETSSSLPPPSMPAPLPLDAPFK